MSSRCPLFCPNCITRKWTCQTDVMNCMKSKKNKMSEIPCHNGRLVNLKGRCIMDSQGLRTSHIDGGYLNQKAVHFKRGYVFKRPRTSFCNPAIPKGMVIVMHEYYPHGRTVTSVFHYYLLLSIVA